MERPNESILNEKCSNSINLLLISIEMKVFFCFFFLWMYMAVVIHWFISWNDGWLTPHGSVTSGRWSMDHQKLIKCWQTASQRAWQTTMDAIYMQIFQRPIASSMIIKKQNPRCPSTWLGNSILAVRCRFQSISYDI